MNIWGVFGRHFKRVPRKVQRGYKHISRNFIEHYTNISKIMSIVTAQPNLIVQSSSEHDYHTKRTSTRY